MNTATANTAARFAVVEFASVDHPGETLYWNFTAWRTSAPDAINLMGSEHALVELARLQAGLPHAAARLAIVDVIAERARAAIFGAAYRKVFEAAGYDDMTKAQRDAARPQLKIEAKAHGDAAVAMAAFAAA
jgi:hypothetical protein